MSTLLQQLTATVERLAPTWGPYLKEKQGLDLNAADLAAELNRSLDVDRAVPGFEDFAPGATRAVAAGEPAHSLLYHALASPNVRPEGITSADYPSWAELDVLENYIYGVKPITAEELAGKVIVVFAYQYRPKPATTHRLYADLAYSRMGFSRVGNTDPLYVGDNRGYTAYTGTSGELAVLPARYAAFLTEKRKGSDDQISMIGEEVPNDNDREFLYPLRKLFAGDECVAGHTLSLTFAESHLCTKLQRVVSGAGTPHGEPLKLPPGLDANRLPFIRQTPDPELAIMQHEGPASVSVRPPAGAIVRLAKQYNSVTKRDEIARFQVTPAVVPSMQEVSAAVFKSPELTALMNAAIPAMRVAHKLDELIVGIGATLDQNPVIAQLSKIKPVATMSVPQIEEALQLAKKLEPTAGPIEKPAFDMAIGEFSLLLTAKLLNDEATEKLVSNKDKAGLLAFDLTYVQKTVLNRHYSSLSMVGALEKVIAEALQLTLRLPARVGRGAPEFTNIRHKVVEPAYPTDPQQFATHLLDLNTLSDKPDVDNNSFTKIIASGGYEAALFEDGVSDGCITASISGLPSPLDDYAAFSIIGAPSMFPRSSDLDLEAWWLMDKSKKGEQFAEGNPQPLAEGRMRANPAITKPDSTTQAFEKSDNCATTIAAVVGRPSGKPGHPPAPNHLRKKFPTSFMPDSASNEFYPGWDVTIDRAEDGSFFYTTHGLGSPYPEDVKFCSAANGFWPAAAPDSARVFHRLDTPTSIPLLDTELGLHPDSPAVKAGAKSAMGWDGGYGPFFQKSGDIMGVNYASLERTDYVSNALAGKFALDLYEKLDSDVLIERMDIQKLAIENLPPSGDFVANTKLWLIVARDGEDWTKKGDPKLKGNGYFLQFVTTSPTVPAVQLQSSPGTTQTNLFTRLWEKVDKVYTCRASVEGIRWWQGAGENPPEGSEFHSAGAGSIA